MIKSSEKKKELHSALSKSIQIDRRTKKRERTSFFGCNRKKKRFMTQDYIDSEKFSLKAATRTKRQPDDTGNGNHIIGQFDYYLNIFGLSSHTFYLESAQ